MLGEIATTKVTWWQLNKPRYTKHELPSPFSREVGFEAQTNPLTMYEGLSILYAIAH